jgi:hypothetical protein
VNVVPAAFHTDWIRLWHLAQRVEAETGENFLDVGLGLIDPTWDPRDGGYQTSPANSTMFAGTGGDGVHFSVVNAASGDSGATPVVMTVPMAFDSPNHIVGANLCEFLALGCHIGYFDLEQLAYPWGRQGLIVRLQTAPQQPDTDAARLLQALIDEFDLQPWRDVQQRLSDLDAMYRGDIQLNDQDAAR